MERRRSMRNRGRYRQRPRPLVEKLKDFCRALTAFIFGHVGICGLVVGYIIVGAFAFMAIEGREDESDSTGEMSPYEKVGLIRNETVARLWTLTAELNVLYRANWTALVAAEVSAFQEDVVKAVGKGYEGHESAPLSAQWTFSGAFLYCLTVITTIGYGNIAPRTIWGKIGTIIYAMVGMPLFLLYVSNIGDILATGFRWTYLNLCKCQSSRRRRSNMRRVNGRNHHHHHHSPGSAPWQEGDDLAVRDPTNLEHASEDEDDDDDEEEPPIDVNSVTVPITICLAVMVGYVCGGALLFAQWETWDFLDGSYFCFISLSTTGLGDLVPGDSFSSDSGVELSLIFCSMYLIIGMALIAMCFNLMQEEVVAKVRRCGSVLGCFRRQTED